MQIWGSFEPNESLDYESRRRLGTSGKLSGDAIEIVTFTSAIAVEKWCNYGTRSGS